MADHGSYGELLYQYEILRARLTIREYFLKNVVRKVYDHVGQDLSLLRVQLSSLHLGFETGTPDKIGSTGDMVSKAISDLKEMCQLFYPDMDIKNDSQFNRTIEQEIKIRYPGMVCRIQKKYPIAGIEIKDNGIIFLGIFFEIIKAIAENNNSEITLIKIDYQVKTVSVLLSYTGQEIDMNNIAGDETRFDLPIFERLQMIGGRLQIKKTLHGIRKLKLDGPIN